MLPDSSPWGKHKVEKTPFGTSLYSLSVDESRPLHVWMVMSFERWSSRIALGHKIVLSKGVSTGLDSNKAAVSQFLRRYGDGHFIHELSPVGFSLPSSGDWIPNLPSLAYQNYRF